MPSTQSKGTFEVPQIRPFQFNLESTDRIKPDVNMFRGEANLFIPIINISAGDGIDLKLSAQYNSNVKVQSGLWNLDAPTSILGLGWSMPLQCIQARYSGSGTKENATFYLSSNGTSNRLYPIARGWTLGKLDKDDCQEDLNKTVLTAALINSFLEQSLLLSKTSVVTVLTKDKVWQISDPQNECEYTIKLEASELIIYDGGLQYEPENFNFSRISYYETFERWQLIDKNGVIYSFGGGVTTNDQQVRTAAGASIAWNVKWGTWHGPSSVTKNADNDRVQQQYPESWYLRSMKNRWNRSIELVYRQTKQAVGEDGLPYTKAIYLESVANQFGQKAEFSYEKKLFGDSRSGGIREYMDPNKPVPDDSPDAYQSKYEDLYLDNVKLTSADGGLLSTLKFGYGLERFLVLPENASPRLEGDSYKRLLTSVTIKMPDGSTQPPETFTYYGINDVYPGGLKTHTFSQGAVVVYEYQKQELTCNARNITIDSPVPGATPRVWFGADYAVVLWYNPSGKLFLEVQTWAGRWIKWTPEVSGISEIIDLSKLNVLVTDTFFVLYYPEGNEKNSTVLFYHKDNLVFGNWLESNDSPLQLTTSQIEVAAGNNFFVVNNYYTNQVVQFTWNNLTKKWIKATLFDGSEARPGLFRYFVSAAGNTFVVLKYDINGIPGNKQNTISLYYLNRNLEWQQGDSLPNGTLSIYGKIKDNFFWSPSSWLFAASYVTSDLNTSFDYTISLLMWDETYRFKPLVTKNYTQASVSQNQKSIPWIASIGSGGMVASGPNLLRYNGTEWLENNNLKIQTTPTDQNLYWFAQGEDIVLKCENTPHQIIAQAQVFDPNTQTTSWQEDAISLFDSGPAQPRLSHYFPTATQNFVTFNNSIYYRGTSTNWVDPFNNPVSPPIPQNANIVSIVNSGSLFMAWLEETGGTAQYTVLKQLSNGTVQDAGQISQNFYLRVDNQGRVQPGNGELPAGGSSFLTYGPMSATFDQASSLYLHRYLNKSLLNNLETYSVYKVTTNLGLTEQVTSYEYDTTNAAIDSTGTIAKFFQVKSWMGVEGQFGYTSYHYYNSIGDSQHPGKPGSPAVLDGLLIKNTSFDDSNQVVKSESTTWKVFTSIKTTPAAQEPSPINGTYVLAENRSTTLDGVETSMNYEYELAAGEITRQQSDLYDSDGNKHCIVKEMTLACQVYPQLFNTNVLKALAQTTLFSGTSEITVLQSSATTWKNFTGPLIEGEDLPILILSEAETYAWLGDTTLVKFKFDGSTPQCNYSAFTGWLLQSNITDRNSLGSILEQKDVQDRTTSFVYDRNGQLKTAQFQNAGYTASECSYYGFESYESPAGWATGGAASVNSSISFTGLNSLQLNKGGSLKNSFTPADTGRAYVLCFWYSTEKGFTAQQDSGWSANITGAGGSCQKNLTYQFIDTKGEWIYGFIKLELDDCDQVTIALTCKNGGDSAVFIDNVQFFPEVSQFAANVYHPSSLLVTNTLGSGLNHKNVFYDRFNRKLGQTDAYLGKLATLTDQFLSLSAYDTFSDENPNQSIKITALEGGTMETFHDNGSWKTLWRASNFDKNWQMKNNMLVHNSSDPDTLQSNQAVSNFILYFELFTAEGQFPAFSSNFKVELTSTNQMEWNPTTKKWTVTIAGKEQSLLSDQYGSPYSIMLVSTESAILFYANGQLLCSVTTAETVNSTITIHTGSSHLGFKNLALAYKPKLTVLFQDGGMNIHQNQTLTHNNAILNQAIYNPQGKAIVTTKNAPVRFGSTGENRALMTYNTAFVNVEGFLDNLEKTGEMEGTVSDYYNGSYQVSNDEQYPYIRNRLESSPLARVVEEGLPGKPYAIANQSTTTPAERSTVKYRYGNNTTIPLAAANDLPPSSYYVQVKTNALGVDTYTMLDKDNNTILKSCSDLTSKTLFSFEATGLKTTQFFPNYFATSLPGNTKFIQTKENNHLKQLVAVSHPDSGLNQNVYSPGGLLRFSQNAVGADEGYYCYFKYDSLNRLVESGVVAGEWNSETLRTHASDPDWPSGLSGQSVQKSIVYTTYSNTANGLGKQARATTDNNETEIQVKETFAYNESSLVREKQVAITNKKDSTTLDSSKTTFAYTFTGNVFQITYPKKGQSQLPPVLYTYDEIDRVSAIGNEAALSFYQGYTYYPDGSLRVSSLNNERQKTDYDYYAPGWVKRQKMAAESASFAEDIGERYVNGNVKKLTDTVGSGSQADAVSTAVSFDDPDRLIKASFSSHQDWNLAVDKYDDNGNVLDRQLGSESQSIGFQSGTDYLTTISQNDKTLVTNTYNKNGATRSTTLSDSSGSTPTASRSLNFSYVKGGFLTQAIRSAETNTTILFAYSNGGQRVLKQTGKEGAHPNSKLYIYGNQGLPLVTCEGNSITSYIYGPNGLVAFEKEGNCYSVTKDHLGSIRVIQDDKMNVVGQYFYDSYGNIKIARGSNPDIVNYRYTGQEWDWETGLYNFRARLYSPYTGTFLTIDPKYQNASPYVYASNNPFDYTDPSGQSLFGDIFSWIAQTIISVTEIVAAVAIDVVTDGAGVAFTGGLLGAGLNGAVDEVSSAAQGKRLSWRDFGESQAIGAVSGSITAGFGSYGEAAGKAVTSLAEENADLAVTTSKALGKAADITVNSVAASAGATSGRFVENIISGNPLSEGLGDEALIGFASAAIGGTFSKIGDSVIGPGASLPKQFASAAVTGALGGAAGGLIASAVEGDRLNGFDLGLAISSGALDAILGIRKAQPNQAVNPANQVIEMQQFNLLGGIAPINNEYGNPFIGNDQL